MKTSRYKYILILFCSAFPFGGFSQDMCLEEVKEIYNRLNNPQRSLEEGGKYYLNCRVRSVSRDSMDGGSSETSFKVIMDKEKLAFESELIKYYQDRESSITIIPGSKIIYINHTVSGFDRKLQQDRMGLLQDTLFHFGEVLSCQSVLLPSRQKGRKVVMGLEDKARSYFGIDEAIFWINDASKSLERVRINYAAGNDLKYAEYEFLGIDYECLRESFTGKAREKVFTTGTKVHPQYSGFQVKDLRSSP